jgi:hypothetical protein
VASVTGTVRATAGRRPIRLGTHLAAWLLASLAHAQSPPAELAGTYAMETPQGRIVVRIEVTAGRLAGTLDAPGSRPIILSGTTLGRYARGTMSSGVDTGEFEALLDGATLDLRLSQRPRPCRQAQRIDPTAAAPPPARAPAPSPGPPATGGAGDARLVGAWSGQTLITNGDASMASEEFLVFRADGSYTRGSGRAVAGGSGWSYEGGGGPAEQGRWRTEDGVLFLAGAQGPWRRIGRYGMTEDGQTMRITYDRGGRKLWTRR